MNTWVHILLLSSIIYPTYCLCPQEKLTPSTRKARMRYLKRPKKQPAIPPLKAVLSRSNRAKSPQPVLDVNSSDDEPTLITTLWDSLPNDET